MKRDSLKHFAAFSAGSLTTSIGMYLAYDQWHPMVWSAVAVSLLGLAQAFFLFVDAS